MVKSRVAVLKTSPRRVLSDYYELLSLAGSDPPAIDAALNTQPGARGN